VRAQRRAISRVRQIGNGMTEAAELDMPRNNKMGQTEHVGCMAVLDGNGYWQLT